MHKLHKISFSVIHGENKIIWFHPNITVSQAILKASACFWQWNSTCFLSRWMMSLLTRTMWRWTASWTFQRAQMKTERCFDLPLSSFMGWSLSLSTHTHTHTHSPNAPSCFCVYLCMCRRWPYFWWSGAVCLTKTPPGSWRLTSTSPR